jgi:hypothetical protein
MFTTNLTVALIISIIVVLVFVFRRVNVAAALAAGSILFGF